MLDGDSNGISVKVVRYVAVGLDLQGEPYLRGPGSGAHRPGHAPTSTTRSQGADSTPAGRKLDVALIAAVHQPLATCRGLRSVPVASHVVAVAMVCKANRGSTHFLVRDERDGYRLDNILPCRAAKKVSYGKRSDLWVASQEVTGSDFRCASPIFTDLRGADFHRPTSGQYLRISC
jgi:hypothetical protein